MALSLRTLSLTTASIGLMACAATQVKPVWETYLPSGAEQRYEMAQVMLRDSTGALISVGDSSSIQTASDAVYVVKQNADGSVRWKTVVDIAAYDHVWDAVLDASGNIYVAGSDYVVKFDSNGFKLWQATLPEQVQEGEANQLVRDIELANGQLYVAGQSLYVLDLNGQLLNTIAQPQPLWDVAVHPTGLYTAGNGVVRKYQADGTPLWQATLSARQDPPAELAITTDGTVYVATRNSSPQDSAYLTRINANGGVAWSKFFADPDTNSYAMPGMPKLQLMPGGNLLLGLSQQPTRVLSLIDANNGNVLKSTSNRQGLINELQVDDKGNIYVAGEATPQKFDANLTLLAEGSIPSETSVTSGGLVVTADSIYVNAGAKNNGTMQFYSARYENK